MENGPLRCLFAASEVAGFAKTGGLADVAAALPKALAQRGLECAVILPLYRSARQGQQKLQATEHTFRIAVGQRPVVGRLWRSTLPDADVPVFLIEQNDYFDRDDPARGRSIYQYLGEENKREDYPDNCERFVFFSRAILEAMRLLQFWPDVLHLNDWQTGLVPVYLREIYAHHPDFELADRYRRLRTLFTIHNMAFQGIFWHLDMPLTGLPWRLFNYEQLEFHGDINFLKAGIVFADAITTVSPTYAREIQTAYFGCRLQSVLAQRQAHLHGIVNGADYSIWNPAADPNLPAHFQEKTVKKGKAACKKALQTESGLEEKPQTPLLGFVSRLTSQKGCELILEMGPELLQQDLQLVVLGEGEGDYETRFLELQSQFPDQVKVTLGLDEKLAHLITAGADVFLMPSQYEPCGLSQLYCLKYGTVPIVRATGGLVDTVADADESNLAAGRATGFSFVPYTGPALLDTVNRALHVYHHDPDTWLALQGTGMRQDWSWNRSAAEYERLYRKIQEQPR